MMKLSQSAQTVFDTLKTRFPGQVEFKRKPLHLLAEELGFGTSDYKDLIADEFKVRKGLYNYRQLIDPSAAAIIKMATSVADDSDEKKPAKKTKEAKKDKPVKGNGRTWKGKDILSGEAPVEGQDQSGTNGDGKSNMRYEWHDDHFVIFRNGVKVSTFKPSNSIGSNKNAAE